MFFKYICALLYLEHFQQSFFLYLKPLEGLLLLDDFLAQGLQTGEVIARYTPIQKFERLKKQEQEHPTTFPFNWAEPINYCYNTVKVLL